MSSVRPAQLSCSLVIDSVWFIIQAVFVVSGTSGYWCHRAKIQTPANRYHTAQWTVLAFITLSAPLSLLTSLHSQLPHPCTFSIYAPPTPICCRFLGSTQPLLPTSLLPPQYGTHCLLPFCHCSSSHTFLRPIILAMPSLPQVAQTSVSDSAFGWQCELSRVLLTNSLTLLI